jgi:hypothetical protein
MNPRILVLLMAAAILGVSYGLLRAANQARAERTSETDLVPASSVTATSATVASSSPAATQPPPEQTPLSPGQKTGRKGKRKKNAAAPAPTTPGPDPASFPTWPDLGFNDPLFRDAESSLRMAVDLSEARLDEPVALVNGDPIAYRELVEECVLRYGMDSVVATVISEYVILSELGRRAMPVTESEPDTESEVQRFVREKYRGKTLGQVLADLHFTEPYFRFQVMLQRAAEDLYKMDEEDGDIPDPFADFAEGPTKTRLAKWEQRVERQKEIERSAAEGGGLREVNQKRRLALRGKQAASHPLFMQLWMGQVMERHRIERDPRLLPQEVFGIVDGVALDLRTIGPRLLLGLTERQRYDALEKLVQRRVLEGIFRDKEVEPDQARVERLIAEEKEEFKGSIITWEMYLQWEETNPDLYRRDLELFDCIDTLQGPEVPDDVLRKHYESNASVFGYAGRRVSHILLDALDPATGLPTGPGAYRDARTRAAEVEAELAKGKDFFELVMRFSEDKETRKYTTIPSTTTKIAGDLGILQRRDRKNPHQVVDCAYRLEKGNVAGPVLSRQGYHFVLVTEVRDPKEGTFEERKKDVLRDFLEQRRQAFIEEVKNKAKVEILFGDGVDPWAPYKEALAG